MPEAKKKAGRDGQLNMRVDKLTKSLIERAADALGQTQSDFVISTARQRATEVLLNRSLFFLEHDDWDTFCAALDAPPRTNSKLKKLLSDKAPWHEEAIKPQGKRRPIA